MHYFVIIRSIYVKNKSLLLFIFRFWEIHCCGGGGGGCC